MEVHRIFGAQLSDDIFEITLVSGEFICWNVTKLQAAAKAGAFGPPVYAQTSDLPAARWDAWGSEDRAKVDYIKTDPAVLNAPAIAIATAGMPEGCLASCFADGQHRITARQELGLAEFSFYLVRADQERAFRVTGFAELKEGL